VHGDIDRTTADSSGVDCVQSWKTSGHRVDIGRQWAACGQRLDGGQRWMMQGSHFDTSSPGGNATPLTDDRCEGGRRDTKKGAMPQGFL
jgi:hypothetical protein